MQVITKSKEIQTVELCGVPVRLVNAGKGSRVLFLHGAAGLQGWVPFFEALADQHEVIAMEHPGFGLSHAQTWANSIGALADFYVRLLKEGPFGRLHLIGSSIGGWLAAEIAVRDESMLKSLTVLAPAGMETPELPLPDMLQWSYPELMRKVFADPVLGERVANKPLSPEERELRAYNGAAFAALLRSGYPNPDLARQLRNVTVPTTIVWGDTDRVTPTGYAPLWKNAMPNARLNVFENCGHLPHVECMDETVRVLRDAFMAF